MEVTLRYEQHGLSECDVSQLTFSPFHSIKHYDHKLCTQNDDCLQRLASASLVVMLPYTNEKSRSPVSSSVPLTHRDVVLPSIASTKVLSWTTYSRLLKYSNPTLLSSINSTTLTHPSQQSCVSQLSSR